MNRLFNPRPRSEYVTEKERLYKASYVVSYIAKKYGVNSVWLWNELEDQYNIIKGLNGVMYTTEKAEFEQYIKEQIEADNA